MVTVTRELRYDRRQSYRELCPPMVPPGQTESGVIAENDKKRHKGKKHSENKDRLNRIPPHKKGTDHEQKLYSPAIPNSNSGSPSKRNHTKSCRAGTSRQKAPMRPVMQSVQENRYPHPFISAG